MDWPSFFLGAGAATTAIVGDFLFAAWVGGVLRRRRRESEVS